MKRFSGSLPDTGRRIHAAPVSDTIHNVVSAANTMTRVTIPADANVVWLQSAAIVFAKFGDATVSVAVPTTTVQTGAGVEIVDGLREIPAGATHVAVISSEAIVASLAFYA